jgi:tetratricopeptide (TPR) repeat protein
MPRPNGPDKHLPEKSPAWVFPRHLRPNSLGWRASSLACKRLREARKEILAVARKDPARAADGVVALAGRIWPALMYVNSSSGSLGNTVDSVLRDLVPLMIAAPWTPAVRHKRLKQLYEDIQEDGVSYLAPIADCWGELCGSQEEARYWIDDFEPMVRMVRAEHEAGTYSHFDGLTMYLSCLLVCGEEAELFGTLDAIGAKIWDYREFGFRALRQLGRHEEALAYAEALREIDPYDGWRVDLACESVLIDLGREDEAFERFAATAHPHTTYLATYRAVAKRYPSRSARSILIHLEQRSEVDSGSWFAAAHAAGERQLALDFAIRGHTAPTTLRRAARKQQTADRDFAQACALLAAREYALGYGYDVLISDASDATHLALELADGEVERKDVRLFLQRLLDAETDRDLVWKAMQKALG